MHNILFYLHNNLEVQNMKKVMELGVGMIMGASLMGIYMTKMPKLKSKKMKILSPYTNVKND